MKGNCKHKSQNIKEAADCSLSVRCSVVSDSLQPHGL